MPDQPADPFLPGDAGSIAVVALYHGLRRAGAGMVEAAVIVAAQVTMTNVVTQAQQQDPPQG
jgi:hypothetical protein